MGIYLFKDWAQTEDVETVGSGDRVNLGLFVLRMNKHKEVCKPEWIAC